MTNSDATESPLEAAAGAAGPEATDAFSILGNETRLSILLALWEAYEPSGDNTVSFSDLRDRVGMRDSGQFNYHLDKLEGHFVRQTDSGYELRKTGQKLVRTVIAGTGIEESTLSPTTLGMTCHRCGEGQTELSYRSESLYLVCPECEGFITTESFSGGLLAVWEFEPAGLANRTPEEVLVAGATAERKRIETMIEGVCPACSGVIDSTLRVCEEHTPEAGEVCRNCGTRDRARVRYTCTVCKNWFGMPVQGAVMNHPAVVAFYYDHDVDVRAEPADLDGFLRTWTLFWEQEHEIAAEDPLQIYVTVPCEGDELRLSLDEELNVIEVSQDN